MSADPILTLDDLSNWSATGTHLAVLGHPIGHSVSPPMHNAALAGMSAKDPRFGRWQYHRFDIDPDDLPDALRLLHQKGFLGVNLTVPHKIIAVPHVAAIDAAAAEIGAVNTLLHTAEGWHGHNTDGYGIATSIREELGIDIEGAHIILLGAGGAARGAAVEFLRRHCASLHIGNRTAASLDVLIKQLQLIAGNISLAGFDLSAPPASLPAGALIVNATSAGLKPSDPLPIDLGKIPLPAAAYDMIYNPRETPLLAQARALGIPAANGLGMLVHQGARSLAIWSRAEVPAGLMRNAVETALATR